MCFFLRKSCTLTLNFLTFWNMYENGQIPQTWHYLTCSHRPCLYSWSLSLVFCWCNDMQWILPISICNIMQLCTIVRILYVRHSLHPTNSLQCCNSPLRRDDSWKRSVFVAEGYVQSILLVNCWCFQIYVLISTVEMRLWAPMMSTVFMGVKPPTRLLLSQYPSYCCLYKSSFCQLFIG